MKKILTILMVTAMMLSVCVLPAFADAQELVSASMPYDTYVYDYDGNPVITPHAYVPSFVVDGEDMGVGALNSPSDLEVDKDGNIYIVDMEYTVDMDALEGQIAQSATKPQATDDADTQADDAQVDSEAQDAPAQDAQTEDAPADGQEPQEDTEAADDEETAFVDTSGFHGRVVILNPDYTVKSVITTFKNQGVIDGFSYPEGITVAHDGTIYVADTMHSRILRFDQKGNLIHEFKEPEISYFDEDFTYKPSKLAVDTSDNIYVVATSVNYGIILLDEFGDFAGFVGAQQVTYSVVDYIWKNILSEAAQDRMEAFVPTEYNNVKIDDLGFLYATTSTIDAEDVASAIASETADSKTSPIKRLNPTGNDVLIRKGYFSTVGDVAFKFDSLGNPETSVIEDVALGPNGRYTLLDSRKNRLFTYSGEGELIYAFSADGYQAGNSKTPVSIAYQGTDLLLLDQTKNAFTVFKITKYGALIDEAYYHYKLYDYEKSMEYWNQVLKENANFDIAYDGIGNAMMQAERYDEATEYFRYSNNKDRYSTALGQSRTASIEDYLLIIAAVAIVAIFLLVKLFGWIGKRNRTQEKYDTFLNKVLYAFYIMIHPFDGFWDVKHEKRGNAKAASVIALFLIVARIISKFFTNYLFNNAYGTKISIVSEILIVVMPLLLWTLSNWCVTTLADGEGSMKDVYVFTCYALLPMALFTIVNTILSHFLILDEGMYLTFFSSLSVIWSGFLIFSGNTQTHRYTVGKSVFSILMAIVGMAIIVFLALVVFTTYQQIYSFLDSIVKEITYRI